MVMQSGGAEGDDETVRVGVESEGDAVRVGAESEGGVEGAERERNEKMKGKRKVSETNFNCADISESEFDDSSDSDYVQPIESDDSDAPSLVFEDIEDSSDEDIFLQKHPSKKHLMRKLKKFVEKEKKQTARQKNREVEVEEGEWFSDPGEEEDLDRVPLSEDENECAKHPIFKENSNLKNVELVVGLTFENAQQYREVLRDWCVRHGYDIEWLKNENRRITVKCKHDGCDWRVHASPIMGGPTFQIKTIKGQHTCARTYDNSLAKTSIWQNGWRMQLGIIQNIPIQQLKNTILRKCNVEVSRFKVLRAKKTALEAIRGADTKQYEYLWNYCETVRQHNPGSKLILRKVDGSDPPVFEKLYFSLFAMKSAFLSGCRPLIGLDGCFLKTCFKGQLLVAVGRDGNDNMVPIALAIVPIENRETWTWFVSELLEDIGGLGTNKWSFISDRQKGLIDALKELVPESEHRYCLRHMYQNFKLKFKSQELKEFFWKAASTANKKDFEAFMKKIESLDPKVSDDVETASEWLKKVPFQHWARSFFPVYLPGVKDYIQTPYEPLKAPQLKKKRGRPKKLRRRGPDELQNTSTRRGACNPEEVATQVLKPLHILNMMQWFFN
ncbi:UNVERIFIED_CONTAM: hypothetical protein Sradi_4372600 [Sesamum radiatum]|uniref:Transposase n=1 Tax=Sesamum radiatum TaxID=300843 RepID=A0AAW2NRB4_SESRA